MTKEGSGFSPIRMPVGNLLGFGNPNRGGVPVRNTPQPPKPKRKVSIADVFATKLVRKPAIQEEKIALGTFEDLPPQTVRGKILITMCVQSELQVTKHLRDDEICIAAWQHWPENFSLGNYDLPDPVKVRCKFSGPSGLIELGYVYRTSSGQHSSTTYAISERAVQWYRAVLKSWQEAG